MIPPRGRWFLVALVLAAPGIVGPGAPGPALAQEVTARGSVGNVFIDNVYLMRERESDNAVVPSVHLGVDFARHWSVEYDGEAEIYTSHTELTSHEHALRLAANPAWGPGERNEAFASLSVETLRNTDTYAVLNHVGGRLTAGVALEPTAWLAWKIGADLRYRRFYDDVQSDALDVMPRAEVRFTLPSRTTLTPRLSYGFRYSPNLRSAGGGSGPPDRTDHQLEAGLHASQGLWDSGGLQAGYFYRHLFSTSAALDYKLTQSQTAFLTTDFLADGHRAYLRFKQLLPKGFQVLASLDYRSLRYRGWPALDAAGNDRGMDREDRRLAPSATLSWEGPAGPVGIEARVGYQYVRQWSNSVDHDTDSHQFTAGLSVEY